MSPRHPISVANPVEIAGWALQAPALLVKKLDKSVVEEEYARLEG